MLTAERTKMIQNANELMNRLDDSDLKNNYNLLKHLFFSKYDTKNAASNAFVIRLNLDWKERLTELIKGICFAINYDFGLLTQNKRTDEVVSGRRAVLWALSTYTRINLKKIAETVNPFGAKDHTNVIHSRKSFNDLCLMDKATKELKIKIVAFLKEFEVKIGKELDYWLFDVNEDKEDLEE